MINSLSRPVSMVAIFSIAGIQAAHLASNAFPKRTATSSAAIVTAVLASNATQSGILANHALRWRRSAKQRKLRTSKSKSKPHLNT